MPVSKSPRKKHNAKAKANVRDLTSAKCMSELTGLHNSCNDMIVQCTGLAPLLRNDAVRTMVNSNPDYLSTVNVIVKDLEQFRARLDEIRNSYAGLIGKGYLSEDELITCLAAGTEYSGWIDELNMVVMPPYQRVLQAIDEMTKGLSDEAASAPVELSENK